MTRRAWRRLDRRLHDPFEAVPGNLLTGTEHGPTWIAVMLDAIASAETSVDVEMYLWDDDQVGLDFVEALRAAAARGLRVRVLVDGSGASSVLRPLEAVDLAGGDVREFSPFRVRYLARYFHRTHKKILICDGRVAYTGGAGFSLHWSSGKRREGPWHDRMFEVRGPAVQQLVRVFEVDFYRWRRRHARELGPPPGSPADVPAAGVSELRVLRGWPDGRDFPATLLVAIREAKERIWLGSPYFIPPPKLITALTKALRRGVRVEMVLPCGNYAHPLLWHASRRHYGFFLARGARIHEFTPGFYHAKLAIVDRATALVGSSNLDYWSWNRNAEVDIAVTDAPTVDMVASLFESDRARSREVRLAEIGMRGLWTSFQEMTAGWIERWL